MGSNHLFKTLFYFFIFWFPFHDKALSDQMKWEDKDLLYITLWAFWLEMEFTSNVFSKHQFSLICQKFLIIIMKIIVFIRNQITEFFFRIFFKWKFCGLLIFCTSKTWFLDLYWVKFICYCCFVLNFLR